MARNLLLIHCHDLGRFVGSYGISTVHTPHLDAFGRSATVFENAFATAPHCSPARASLFTGTYPQTNGVLGLTHAPFAWDLRNPNTHLAHRLQDRGYRCELVGVHHESLVLDDESVGRRLGFDLVQSGGDRNTVTERTRAALDRAAEDERPFYLQVGFHEPHRAHSRNDDPGVMGFLGNGIEADEERGVTVPGYLADDDGSRREVAELQGAVRHMDEGVGEVLAHLKLLGLADETVVLFTTDHGLPFPRAKCSLYDPGIEVSLMIRVPDRACWSGKRIPEMVSHVDVVPTVVELLGLGTADRVEGNTLVPLVENGSQPSKYSYSQLTHHTYYDPKRSIRSATHKLIANFGNAPRVMDPTQSWIHRSAPIDLGGATVGSSPAFELFDLAADPVELVNLAGDRDHSHMGQELATALLAWMHAVDDPLLELEPASPVRHRDTLLALRHGRTTTGRTGVRPFDSNQLTSTAISDRSPEEMEPA